MLLGLYLFTCHLRNLDIYLCLDWLIGSSIGIGYWLALSWTAPLPELSLGVGSAIRAKQLPGPLAIGSRDSLSLWATSRLCRPVQDLLAGKRALLEFTLSPKATTPGPWKNQPLTTLIEQKKEASRSSVSPVKRKYIFGTSHLPVIVSILERQLGGWHSMA